MSSKTQKKSFDRCRKPCIILYLLLACYLLLDTKTFNFQLSTIIMSLLRGSKFFIVFYDLLCLLWFTLRYNFVPVVTKSLSDHASVQYSILLTGHPYGA